MKIPKIDRIACDRIRMNGYKETPLKRASPLFPIDRLTPVAHSISAHNFNFNIKKSRKLERLDLFKNCAKWQLMLFYVDS